MSSLLRHGSLPVQLVALVRCCWWDVPVRLPESNLYGLDEVDPPALAIVLHRRAAAQLAPAQPTTQHLRSAR